MKIKEKPKYIYSVRGGRTVRLKIENRKVVKVKPENLPEIDLINN